MTVPVIGRMLVDSYRTNRWYRYLLFLVAAVYAWFVIFERYISIPYALSTGSVALLIGHAVWLVGVIVVMATIGIMIHNRGMSYSEEELSEIRRSRIDFFGLLSIVAVQTGIWFILVVISVFSTDSCGGGCLSFQKWASLPGEFFLPMAVISILIAFYAHSFRNFSLVRRTVSFGWTWLWLPAFGPVIFLILMLLFFSHPI
jgi:hypothetical protein